MVLIVKAAALIDGTGRPPIRHPWVVIDGGRIARIAAGEAPDLPSDAEVIDARATTLLPGLIDCHEHLGLRFELGYERGQMEDPDREIVFRMAKSAAEAIQCGVTSVRIASEKNHLDVLAKKYIDAGYIPGPRVYPSGAGLRPSHGHGATPDVVDGFEAVRRGIRDAIGKGSHHIKLFVTGGIATLGSDPRLPYFSQEEIRVAIDEAHRVGRKVMAHIYGGPGADWAIEAGVDSVEHGAYLSEQQIAWMAERGTWLVPTLTVIFHDRGAGDALQPPEVIEKFERAKGALEDVVRNAIRMGVKIATGCDSWHGKVWYEMEHLVRLGMAPMDAIRAATSGAADLLGEREQIGTVEEGKLADLVAVAGDPLEDISVVREVRLVLRDGIRFVDAAAGAPRAATAR